MFVQKDLAKTLKLIAENGKDGFYKGEVAEKIVSQIHSQGGIITFEDLANYNPVERKPLISLIVIMKLLQWDLQAVVE